jgi:hypothetical protein
MHICAFIADLLLITEMHGELRLKLHIKCLVCTDDTPTNATKEAAAL